MKRLLASLVLVLFLFNILGYGGLLLGLKNIANERLTARLDVNRHAMGGSMTIKMPYSGYMEPDYMVNMEIKRDGDIFRVINQRQYADTLYLVCIKDEISTKISDTFYDFVQSFAGNDEDNQNVVKTTVVKDYITTVISLTRMENGWEKVISPPTVSIALSNLNFAPPTPPPGDNQ